MDYSSHEAYLLQGEIVYRPEKFFFRRGNDSKTLAQDFGAGRSSINWRNSLAGQAINNPYLDNTCFAQPPIVWMTVAPFNRQIGKFVDVYFYKNHIFEPGSN